MMSKGFSSIPEIEAELAIGMHGQALSQSENRSGYWHQELRPSPTEEQTLHIACHQGDLEEVKRLAAENPMWLREKDRAGMYPLHIAIWNAHAEIVDFLLDLQGSYADQLVDSFNNKPIHLAAYCRASKVVKRLVVEFGCPIQDFSRENESNRIIHLAAMNGCVDTLRFLMEEAPESTASRRASVTDLNIRKENVLFSTIVLDRFDAFLYCLNRYPAGVDELDEVGYPLFWGALTWGATRITKYMFEKGLVRCNFGPDSPLDFLDAASYYHEPATAQHEGTFGTTLEEEKSNERSQALVKLHPQMAANMFVAAAKYGALEVLQWLYSIGHDPKDAQALYKPASHPLMLAAAEGCGDIVRWLIEKCHVDSELTIPNNSMTPLVWSCHRGELETAKYLYERTRQATMKRPDLAAALHEKLCSDFYLMSVAISAERFAIMEWLLDEEIEHANQVDLGKAYLTEAVLACSIVALEWLLDRGVVDEFRESEFEVSDGRWRPSAFLTAVATGQLDMMEMLREKDPECILPFRRGAPELSPEELVHGRSALYVAITSNQMKAAEWLIAHDTSRELLELQDGSESFVWPDYGLSSFQISWTWNKLERTTFQGEDGLDGEEANEEVVGWEEIPVLLVNPIAQAAFEFIVQLGGNLPCLKWLVECGFDMVQSKINGYERPHDPMFMAMDYFNLDALKIIVEMGCCSLFVESSHGSSPLDHAAATGDVGLVKYVAERMRLERPDCNFDDVGGDGVAPTAQALQRGHVEAFKYLIEECKCVVTETSFGLGELAGTTGKFGFERVWSLIAYSGCTALWQLMEEHLGHSYTFQLSEHSKSPLRVALEFGKVGMAKFLIDERQLNVEAECDDEHWMNIAIHNEESPPEMLSMLYQRGFSLVQTTPQFKGSAVHLAANRGNLPVLKWLHNMGLSIKAQDTFGFTPIALAASENRLEVVKWLLRHGAKLAFSTSVALDLLELANTYGAVEVAQFFGENCGLAGAQLALEDD